MEQRRDFGHTTKLRILQREDQIALKEVANPFMDPEDLHIPYRSRRKTHRTVFHSITPINALNFQKDIADRKIYQFRRYMDLLKGTNPMPIEWKKYGEKHVDEIYVLLRRSRNF